jgi:hypothetical protein
MKDKQRLAYVYEVGIIDIWKPMVSFEDFYDSCSYDERLSARIMLDQYLYHIANYVVSYWEGDIRPDQLYIGEIPDVERCGGVHRYIGFKQDNNGTSYLIFPFPMPIYAQYECKYDEYLHKQPNYHDECLDILNTYAPEPNRDRYLANKISCLTHSLEHMKCQLERIKDLI